MVMGHCGKAGKIKASAPKYLELAHGIKRTKAGTWDIGLY